MIVAVWQQARSSPGDQLAEQNNRSASVSTRLHRVVTRQQWQEPEQPETRSSGQANRDGPPEYLQRKPSSNPTIRGENKAINAGGTPQGMKHPTSLRQPKTPNRSCSAPCGCVGGCCHSSHRPGRPRLLERNTPTDRNALPPAFRDRSTPANNIPLSSLIKGQLPASRVFR